VAATLLRGALRWIRLPAPKRAVWVCCQAARMLTPPLERYDREGVFYAVSRPGGRMTLPPHPPRRCGIRYLVCSSQ
jgi:hypothetical protein